MQNDNGALPTPNWDLWANMPSVKLWEAVALSMPMEPEAVQWNKNAWMAGTDYLHVSWDDTFSKKEDRHRFKDRYKLLESCYPYPPFTNSLRASSLHRSPVNLIEFVTWASTQRLFEPLPARLCTLIVRSSPAKPSGSANWDKWRLMPRVPLWKAVCLSFDLEPRVDIDENHLRSRGRFLHGVPNLQDRLEILQANLSTNGPIRPQGALYAGMLQKPDCLVLLSEVGEFLSAKGLEIPTEMAAPSPQAAAKPQAGPGQLVTEGVVVGDATKPGPVEATQAVGPVFSTTRSALIARHKENWPSIEGDLKSASENGLSAAKAGKRDWNETVALEWARAKNKLKSAQAADSLDSAMRNLPSVRHTLKG